MNYNDEKSNYWLACDVWTINELQFLLAGQWPEHGPDPPSNPPITIVQTGETHRNGRIEVEGYVIDPLPTGHTLRDTIEDAVTSGALTAIRRAEILKSSRTYARDLELRFRPIEAIAWAMSRGCFPDFAYGNHHVERLQRSEKTRISGAIVMEGVDAPDTTSSPAPVLNTQPDVALLATREQLIAAFGSFTGMDADWFNNITHTPALLAARKVTGQGGRGHIAVPLFCPFAVLQWLLDPARRKGRTLRQDKGWQLFESHFPRAYAAFSVGDPRTD